MSREQTAYVNDDIKIVVNVIGSNGNHEAATIDLTTTRLDGYSTVPTVNTIATGIYEIVFSGVTPAPVEADRLICKINGTVTSTGTAWTTYGVPVIIVAEMKGTDNASTFDNSVDTVITDTASRDASKADVSALATAASIAALNNFDPTADTVANVTTVGSVTNPVATDSASRTASQADVSSLATSSEISALNNFNPATDQVIVATNNDKTGYSISGTKTTLDALNDIAATDIVSGGAINTSAGAVSNVTTVATTTTNTDMVDISGLATSASISALNDISAADVWSYATRTITSGGITAGEVSDAVWDVALSSYNSPGSTGKALRQLKEGVISQDGQVNDLSATATTFVSNLSSAVDGYYHDKVIVFVSGSLSGQARHIETYIGSTKSITVSQAFTSAPSNGDEFLILATHEHSLSEIADATWDEPRSGHSTIGTFGYYLDARVSQVGGGGGASAEDIWGALLVDYATPGTFGARFQEADRYTNTTANIRYITQGNSYDGTANPEISWAVSKDYTGYDSVVLEIIHRVTGTVLLNKTIAATDATTIKASLSAADTAFTDLTTPEDFGPHRYIITATSGSSVDSAVIGAVVITET